MTFEQIQKLCTRLNASPWQQRVLHEELTDSPWHTGTPTEEGWYLLYTSKPNASYHLAFYQFGHWFSTDEYCIVREDVVAWMPIPPYEENPIEAFMSKQPCDKCLFQNTPNCKIFGIGVNGEMGCTFKEKVRMSELKGD